MENQFLSSPPVVVAFGLAVVFLASLPIVRRAPELGSWIALGFAAKLCGSAANYWFTLKAYGSLQDVELYHRGGVAAAEAISNGRTWPELSVTVIIPGPTANVSRLLGWWYLFAGPSVAWAYFAWAIVGFVGSLAFVRAGQIVAAKDSHRFSKMILLFPSVIFYPSIVGKDALAFAGLGLVTIAVAKLVTSTGKTRVIGAAIPASVGMATLWVIRPHVAAIALVAVGATVLGSSRIGLGPLLRLFGGVGLALAMSWIVRGQVMEIGAGNAVSLLRTTAGSTSIGGAAFDNRSLESPVRFAIGVSTVLFRPWMYEARSIPQLVASVEGVFLLGLALHAASQWRRLAARLRDHAFVRFAMVNTLGLLIMLVAISNFGLLARQRTQVLPFIFALVFLEMNPGAPSRCVRTLTNRSPNVVQLPVSETNAESNVL